MSGARGSVGKNKPIVINEIAMRNILSCVFDVLY